MSTLNANNKPVLREGDPPSHRALGVGINPPTGSTVGVDGSLNVSDEAQFGGAVGIGTAPVAGVPLTVSSAALTTPVIDGVTYGGSDRQLKCKVFDITGAALHAANLTAFTAPAACIIERVVLDVTTKSTGAATVDIGYTAVSATTASDTLLDGVDVGTAAAMFDSMDATLDSGANAKAQRAASGKFVTIHENADTTGMVAKLYVYFTLI